MRKACKQSQIWKLNQPIVVEVVSDSPNVCDHRVKLVELQLLLIKGLEMQLEQVKSTSSSSKMRKKRRRKSRHDRSIAWLMCLLCSNSTMLEVLADLTKTYNFRWHLRQVPEKQRLQIKI